MAVVSDPPNTAPPTGPGRPPPPSGHPPLEPERARPWRRIVLGCLIVLLCAAGASAKFVSGEVETLRSDLSINPSLHVGNSLAPAAFGGPQTLLLVGNDQRKHTTTTPVLPHANEMLLVRIDPSKPYISMMSLPRELMVPIHTTGGIVNTRLNAALTYGGIPLLVTTIKQVTGLSVNHVIEIDFNHFKDAVNEIGCVYSTVDRRYYHVNVPGGPQYQEINLQPGYQRMCGSAALQFVSYRHGDTSIVRDARDQSFLLDVKKQYGPTLVDNVHKFERVFGENVQTDPSLHTTSGVLNLIGTLVSSASLRVRQVQFDVTLQPIGANPCACDTATRQQIASSVHNFLYGSSPAPKKRTSQIANAVHKRHGAASLPLTPTSSGTLAQARADAAKLPFPLEIPRVQDKAGSVTPVDLRTYAIDAPGGVKAPAYVAVFQAAGLGQYYDVQGTTWTTPPLLDSPNQSVSVGGRTYYLYYEGQHLEVVAWYEHGAAYWVRNTLTQALGNGELLAIAQQTAPASSHIGHAAKLRAAAVPQRAVSEPEYGITHTLGSIGGLLALLALPVLAIPLVKRRRELAGLRAQLAGTMQMQARLSLATPVGASSPAVRSGSGNGGERTLYRAGPLSTRTRVAILLGALVLACAGVVGIVLNVDAGGSHHVRIRHVAQTIPSVPVAVLNATSQQGAARSLARQLHKRGVKVATVGNLERVTAAGVADPLYAAGTGAGSGALPPLGLKVACPGADRPHRPGRGRQPHPARSRDLLVGCVVELRGAPRRAQAALELAGEVVDGGPDLGERVAVADGHGPIFQRLVVDRHCPGSADLVLAAVAAPDRAALVVLDLEGFAQLQVNLARQLRLAVFAHERQDRDLDRRERGVQPQHGAPLPLDLVLVVGVGEEGQHGPVDSQRGLDHVRHVALAARAVDVLELLARIPGVLGQVEVAAVGDPLELGPPERVQVLEVAGRARVVGELLLVMGT